MDNRYIHRQERGLTRTEWLTSHHSFSFASWYEPDRTRFGSLRVLNDDVVSPQSGFELHRHKDMEIVSIVLSGELEHLDTVGNHGILQSGDIQVMSAGTGIRHAEKNPSETVPVRFLQLWIQPDQPGHIPRYQQASGNRGFSDGFEIIVSDGSKPESLTIHSRTEIYLGRFSSGQVVTLPPLAAGRGQFLYAATGRLSAGKNQLDDGDAIQRVNRTPLHIKTTEPATIVLVDVPLS